jgi:hypothetical protein
LSAIVLWLPKSIEVPHFLSMSFPLACELASPDAASPSGAAALAPSRLARLEREVCIKWCHAPVPFIQAPSFTLTAPIRFIRFTISPTRLNSESRLTSTRGRLGSEDQKGWGALTLVGDLVGSSQHRPALGPTRQETVSRHLSSHASSHLSSVLLCASVFQTPSPLGAQTRFVNTEAQR